MFHERVILSVRRFAASRRTEGCVRVFSVALGALFGLCFGVQAAITPISIQFGSPVYSQSFDTLANSGTSASLPAGWGLLETGNPGHSDLNYTAGTGSSSTADTYSFGLAGSTERALGTLGTTKNPNVVSRIGVALQNVGPSPITSLVISYSGEQWRLGGTSTQDKLLFQYSLNATDLSDTWTWNNFTAGDFNAPVTSGTVGALNGNNNSQSVAFTLNGLNLAQNATIWLRWYDTAGTAGESGLAIDDFSLTAVPEPSAWGVGAAVFLGLVGLVKHRASFRKQRPLA